MKRIISIGFLVFTISTLGAVEKVNFLSKPLTAGKASHGKQFFSPAISWYGKFFSWPSFPHSVDLQFRIGEDGDFRLCLAFSPARKFCGSPKRRCSLDNSLGGADQILSQKRESFQRLNQDRVVWAGQKRQGILFSLFRMGSIVFREGFCQIRRLDF